METREQHSRELVIRWLGHASVLIEAGEAVLLCDPVLRSRIAHLRRYHKLDLDWIDRVDAVLISHAHNDHLDIPTLRLLTRRLEKDLRILAPPGADRVLRRAGFDQVETIRVGDHVEIDGADVEVSYAHHRSGRPGLRDQSGDEAVGFVVRAPGRPSCWYTGDSDLTPEFEALAPVDVALIGVGGWWRTVGVGHFTPQTAVEAVELVRARVAIPIHWGTFHPLALGRFVDPVRELPARQFVQLAGEAGSAIETLVPTTGERLVIALEEDGARIVSHDAGAIDD